MYSSEVNSLPRSAVKKVSKLKFYYTVLNHITIYRKDTISNIHAGKSRNKKKTKKKQQQIIVKTGSLHFKDISVVELIR